ncbi:hypothetical protein [Paenibacillus cremeus]|uniref:hypothetical protein n=1 Tax=Paenibacillus cremeus TaxID=2163881 RepID=UPI001648F335|nr:hypothetical protein [Paenibacillus cremeus]
MGFLKDLGKFAGEVTGKVIGGSVRVVGELTGSDYIKEIGDGVENATIRTGETLGNAASGIWDVGAGIITQDEKQLEAGFSDVGQAVGSTIMGVGQGIGYVYENGKDVVSGLKDGDGELLKQGAKNLVKVAAVGVLAIGIVDVVDGVDGIAEAADLDSAHDTPIDANHALGSHTDALTDTPSDRTVENPNTHHVDPYLRHNADGSTTWVDGDGDSSVNSYGGWTQTNPDYKG